MGFSLDLFLTTAVTLFVIIDPPGLLPVFLALTSSLDQKARRRAGTRASAVAFGVIAIFAVFGRQILDYLQVSVPAMAVSGGLLLLLVALLGAIALSTQEPQPSPGKGGEPPCRT
mgnify:CR=1 FL=1